MSNVVFLTTLVNFQVKGQSILRCGGRGTRILRRSFVFISGAPGLFNGNVDIALFPSRYSLFGQDDPSSALFNVARTLSQRSHSQNAWEENRKGKYKTVENGWAEENDLDEKDDFNGEFKKCEHFSERDARDQIIKQAITMSLCKKNIVSEERPHIDHLSDASFVPVVGIDQTSFVVALYDSEYDYLLLSSNSEEIFDHTTLQLSPKAIIHLWMIIHHNQFCCKPPQSLLKHFKGTCRLQEQVGGAHRLEEAKRNAYWTYMKRRDQGKDKRLDRSISDLRDLVIQVNAFNLQVEKIRTYQKTGKFLFIF